MDYIGTQNIKISFQKILNQEKYNDIFTVLTEARILNKAYKDNINHSELNVQTCKRSCLEKYLFLLCWKVCLFQDMRIPFSFLFVEPEHTGKKTLPFRMLQEKNQMLMIFIFPA